MTFLLYFEGIAKEKQYKFKVMYKQKILLTCKYFNSFFYPQCGKVLHRTQLEFK